MMTLCHRIFLEKHARWLNLLLKASSENKKKLKEEFYNEEIRSKNNRKTCKISLG